MNTFPEHLSKLVIKSVQQLIPKYDNFVFDCDGVLWKMPYQIEFAKEFMHELRRHNKGIYIVTNASQKTRLKLQSVLKEFFEIDVPYENIFASNYLTSQYIKANFPDYKKAYVLGDDAIRQELTEIGISSNDSTHSKPEYYNMKLENIQERILSEIKESEEKNGKYDCVIFGLNHLFNMYSYNYASILIQRGAKFIVTNPDKAYRTATGCLGAGNGSIWRALANTVGQEPICAGKPNTFCWDHMEKNLGIDRKTCLMIGDNLTTDIPFGKTGGIDTLLIMTGVTTCEFLANAKPQDIIVDPDYIVKDFEM